MARTRAAKGTKGISAASTSTTTTSVSKYSLPEGSDNPPKIFILPNKATTEARVVSLKNPRYSKPTRYLVCPETGTYEFTKISAPKTTPRSWLVESDETVEGGDTEKDEETFKAQVTKGADLFVATPIDPLFLVLPALSKQLSSAKRLFLSSDDHFDSIADEATNLSDILKWTQIRKSLESRMGVICETVEAGDESMFRFSEEKLLAQVLCKAKRMSENGLPKSMEEKFVNKALEAPVLSVKRTDSAVQPSSQSNGADSGTTTPQTESQSSVSTAATSATDISEASTAATSVPDETEVIAAKDVTSVIKASDEVVKLQRLRIAFNFICSSYVPPAMSAALNKLLAEGKGSVDFAPLDDYVARLTKLRQEALTARSASDYSRKRGLDEEDDDRAEKRRKKEEEEKRKKAGESRGVKNLKKVNTAGMKKMSDFFKKK